MTTPRMIDEPARRVPVVHECDVCVIGGSCTGLFAAVRAARLGARVAIVEQHNCFGGVATLSMVNIWHSLLDTRYERPIIGGLTVEVLAALQRRQAVTIVERRTHAGSIFNSEELKLVLDELAQQAKLRIYFHTQFVAPHVVDGRLAGILVENKSGRGAILAAQFVDASGDGDLAARLGLATYRSQYGQPATACARFENWSSLQGLDYGKELRARGPEFNLPLGFAWGCLVPHSDTYMMAATRMAHCDSTDADSLTAAELEGRRQVRAIMDILRAAAPAHRATLQALPSRLGLRESRHVRCRHQLTGDEVLSGQRFPDAIANGSYRVDIHHVDQPGITLRYLDGSEEYARPGYPYEHRRWRPETASNPTFYQIPWRALVPAGGYPNVVVAGRMLDVDPVAHGAVRVMVNLNQTGEAAGVAAWLALSSSTPIPALDPALLRTTLAAGGSLII